MKKNLLSILILALLVVNIVISVISMISVSGASKKTASLVADIATIIDLEIDGVEKTNVGENVPMSDIGVYNIADQMTINLKDDGDGKSHIALVKVSLSMNKQNEDYATYGTAEAMAERESLIKGVINEVIGSHTAAEMGPDNQAAVRKEILAKVQQLFSSDFIYDVSFSDIIVQ